MSLYMTEQEVLEAIEKGDSAFGLLTEADANLVKRFKRVDASIVKLLKDVKRYFPDAEFYTSGGDGFSLLLGKSHDLNEKPQQQLTACHGAANIGGGDW